MHKNLVYLEVFFLFEGWECDSKYMNLSILNMFYDFKGSFNLAHPKLTLRALPDMEDDPDDMEYRDSELGTGPME